ncbi:unnamed protein product [Phaedon cochleariae]|uniref:J domain-containing protein n=1 Tax=Phaedon cochleariae TaxID=80249 RepID=A0A9N9X309_PHACE|nr:unnamed protein product [Phaedon cochleariae]
MLSFLHTSRNPQKNVRNMCTSQCRKNHYEVLNLPRNCKSKEIKESFIKLSKEHHPDLNKSKDAHKMILEINEAYKILGNTESRRIYDLGLAPSGFREYSNRNDTTNIYHNEQFRNDAWNDKSFYENRNKSQDDYYKSKPYYGINGIKRTSNFRVLISCLFIATLAVGLQFFVIKKSFELQVDDLIEKSNRAQDSLKTVRETANTNGNQVQIEILKHRFAVKDKTE